MAKKQEVAPMKNYPSHGVFVVEGDGDRAFRTKIGSAWAHGDGQGFNVQLSAIPVGGRLIVRTRKDGEQ